MSETTQIQRAELLDAAREGLTPVGQQVLRAVLRDLDAAEHENAALRDTVRLYENRAAAAERDAKRYRWLRNNQVRAHSPHMDSTHCWMFAPSWIPGRHLSFDAAVDAVMSTTQGDGT